MAMPDGVDALLRLASAPRDRLTLTAYNVRAFNPSAGEIRSLVVREFPAAKITFDVDDRRQGIVDSWPADVDDTAARRDWGFKPQYDLDRAFSEYLMPAIRKRYSTKVDTR
jgi:nucleoside-diphosphate-sugar epimerase